MLNLCLINNSNGFYTPQNKTFKSWLNFLKSNENFEINIVLENKDKMRENIETLSGELNDRISREIGGWIANVNVLIQRAAEQAICFHVLPQVQNVLRDVQNSDASGPRDQEIPEWRPDCLDRWKQGQMPRNSSKMTLKDKENLPQSHCRGIRFKVCNYAAVRLDFQVLLMLPICWN